MANRYAPTSALRLRTNIEFMSNLDVVTAVLAPHD
jgi:hypothetical protein